jgi:hypothetical protein
MAVAAVRVLRLGLVPASMAEQQRQRGTRARRRAELFRVTRGRAFAGKRTHTLPRSWWAPERLVCRPGTPSGPISGRPRRPAPTEIHTCSQRSSASTTPWASSTACSAVPLASACTTPRGSLQHSSQPDECPGAASGGARAVDPPDGAVHVAQLRAALPEPAASPVAALPVRHRTLVEAGLAGLRSLPPDRAWQSSRTQLLPRAAGRLGNCFLLLPDQQQNVRQRRP